MKFILTMLTRLIVACLFLMAATFVVYIFYSLVYLLIGIDIPLPTTQEAVVFTLLILGGFYCIDVAVDMVSEFIDFKV